ncbi:hypothetical protein OIU74_026753 [Salix koriyanagi]|uniref:Uncharacterized protein n=1 Tax=Salix koriyanagi TaxID=2511006 RepID=A0A9Q0W1X0_9ROSI|nr:hypothetical protein OIU74_026753 [Salix koriyanagi]
MGGHETLSSEEGGGHPDNSMTLDTNLHALAIGGSSHHPFIASSGKYSGSAVTNIASSSGAAISSSTKHDQASSSLPPDSSPRSAASSSIEHLVGRGTSSHSRNIIHPRGTSSDISARHHRIAHQ